MMLQEQGWFEVPDRTVTVIHRINGSAFFYTEVSLFIIHRTIFFKDLYLIGRHFAAVTRGADVKRARYRFYSAKPCNHLKHLFYVNIE